MNAPRSLLCLVASLGSVAWTGCGGRDPILDKVDALDDEGGAAARASAAGAKPAEPRRVQPGDPAPAAPSEPSPGAAAEPTPGRPAEPTPVAPEAPPPTAERGPTLRGTVVLPEGVEGTVKVDVFDGDQRAASQGGSRPRVVGVARLDGAGSFSVRVPPGVDEVWVGAFADTDGDGRPGPSDPQAWFAGNPVRLDPAPSPIELRLEVAGPPPGG